MPRKTITTDSGTIISGTKKAVDVLQNILDPQPTPHERKEHTNNLKQFDRHNRLMRHTLRELAIAVHCKCIEGVSNEELSDLMKYRLNLNPDEQITTQHETRAIGAIIRMAAKLQ